MSKQWQIFFQAVGISAGITSILSAISTISTNTPHAIPITFAIIAIIAGLLYWESKHGN